MKPPEAETQARVRSRFRVRGNGMGTVQAMTEAADSLRAAAGRCRCDPARRGAAATGLRALGRSRGARDIRRASHTYTRCPARWKSNGGPMVFSVSAGAFET